MEIAYSVNEVPIRITSERWMHVVENHDELAGRLDDVIVAIEEPDRVTEGYRGGLIAWKGYGRGKNLAVIYKESTKRDGFLITAFFTSKPKKGRKIWP